MLRPGAWVEWELAGTRALVAAGQGERRHLFPDLNVGQAFEVEASAKAWLSYFEPEGLANMPRNCARMPAMPFLWVIGRQDNLFAGGSAYAFDRAPRHPMSRYVVVEADHMATPDRARGEVAAWLRALRGDVMLRRVNEVR